MIDKVAIKCPNEEDIKRLVDIFNKLNIVWISNSKFTKENSRWNNNEEETYYFINDNKVCFGTSSSSYGYIVYSVEEFINKYNKIMRETFKKSDLENGMVVENREGERKLVCSIQGKTYLVGENNYTSLEYFDDDLKKVQKDISQKDIVRVYNSDGRTFKNIFDYFHLTLIWKGNDKITISMNQIAEKFGVPVEDINIIKG